MEIVTSLVPAQSSTRILLDSCALEHLVQNAASEMWQWRDRHCLAVADSKVLHHWHATIASWLDRQTGKSIIVPIDVTGSLKQLHSFGSMLELFLSHGVTQGSLVIGIGGGTLTDAVGFAASTVLRGVDRVLIPTTLVAQADAAISGKTGLDYRHRKNLVGTYSNPLAVVVSTAFLSTLTARELADGLAEMLKVAIAGSPALLNLLMTLDGPYDVTDPETASKAVSLSLQTKIRLLPLQQRAGLSPLDLGHTLSNAIELLPGMNLTHGQAVGIDLCASTRLSVANHMMTTSEGDAVLRMCERLGVPSRLPALTDAEWRTVREHLEDVFRRRGNAADIVVPDTACGVRILRGVPTCELVDALR